MKIINFSDLSQGQKCFIWNIYLNTKFNQTLSFAIVNDVDDVVGFALLNEKSIDESISLHMPFNTKRYACEIVRIYEIDLYKSKEPSLFNRISKEIILRILQWKDEKKGRFCYYWGLFYDNVSIEPYANALDCSIIKFVEGADTVRYVIYKELSSD